MFDVESCVAFITSQSAKKMGDIFNRRLMKLGSSKAQWLTLYYLGLYPAITQKDLALKMNIKSPTLTRLIDRMEKEDYVIRSQDNADKRIIHLHLTLKGQSLREKLLPEGEKMSKIFSANITDDEMDIFKKVVDKMAKNAAIYSR